MNTPWGKSQHIDYLNGKDIISVHTAGHGGIGVKKELAEENNLHNYTTDFGGLEYGYYWFEEDCDWIIPFYICPSWTAYLEESFKKDKQEITKMIFELAKVHHTLKPVEKK